MFDFRSHVLKSKVTILKTTCRRLILLDYNIILCYYYNIFLHLLTDFIHTNE